MIIVNVNGDCSSNLFVTTGIKQFSKNETTVDFSHLCTDLPEHCPLSEHCKDEAYEFMRRCEDRLPGAAEDLRGRIDVILAQISQQDVLACADPPRNRLTDRSGSDDDDNIGHCNLLSSIQLDT